MGNKFKEQPKVEEQEKPKAPAKENKVVRSVASVVSGNFLSKDSTVKNLPFIFFLSFLAICYIANGYYADDQVRKVNRLTNEIKELRTQYIVEKDSLVVKSKQTEVAKALAKQATGIKESVV
ncbi:MAG: FtsL-like putative cell division protein, partial [Bacteroidia bacterium]